MAPLPVIAVTGRYEDGTGEWIQSIAGSDAAETSSIGLRDLGGRVHEYACCWGNIELVLLDVCGYNSDDPEYEPLNAIKSWLLSPEISLRGITGLTGLILLRPMSTTRWDRHDSSFTRSLLTIIQSNTAKSFMLGTNLWDEVSPDIAERRYKEWQQDGFWGAMLGRGARMERLTNVARSRAAMKSLINRSRGELIVPSPISVELGSAFFNTEGDLNRRLEEELEKMTLSSDAEISRASRELRTGMTQVQRDLDEQKEQSNSQQEQLTSVVEALEAVHRDLEKHQQRQDLIDRYKQLIFETKKNETECIHTDQYGNRYQLMAARFIGIGVQQQMRLVQEAVWNRLTNINLVSETDSARMRACAVCFRSVGNNAFNSCTQPSCAMEGFLDSSYDFCLDCEADGAWCPERHLRVVERRDSTSRDLCPRRIGPPNGVNWPCNHCENNVGRVYLHCCRCKVDGHECWDMCMYCTLQGRTCRNVAHPLYMAYRDP